MLKRILLIAAGIAISIGVSVWLKNSRNNRRHEAFLSQTAPAAKSMSADLLVDSEWAYSGPLGDLTLHFNADRTLHVTKDGNTGIGRWDIQNIVLRAWFPGDKEPHIAMFRQSTDMLSGSSPGLHSHNSSSEKWTAERME